MLRLALNAASNRVVLVNGHTGTGATGQVIESFESLLLGNCVVGHVFGILILINFLVITKGAYRVSEVTAIYTGCNA